MLVVNTRDILAGRPNALPSDVLSATAGWGAVHGPQEAYTQVAMKLLSMWASGGTHGYKRTREGELAPVSGDPQRSRGLSLGAQLQSAPVDTAAVAVNWSFINTARRGRGRTGRVFSES